MKKIFSIIFSVLIVLSLIPFSASAADKLTVERAVQISDGEILVYFSEPVAVNLNEFNRGPFVALRLVDNANKLIWNNKGDPMQEPGSIRFIDSTHQVMSFKYYVSEYDNITELLDGGARFADFLGSGYVVRLCFEEITYNNSGSNDLLLDNITTVDGKVRLSGNLSGGYDGVYLEVEKDFSIKTDESAYEDCSDPDTSVKPKNAFDVKKIENPNPVVDTEDDDVTTAETKKNEKKGGISPVAILVLAVAVAILLVVVALALTTGGKKDGKKEEEKK